MTTSKTTGLLNGIYDYTNMIRLLIQWENTQNSHLHPLIIQKHSSIDNSQKAFLVPMKCPKIQQPHWSQNKRPKNESVAPHAKNQQSAALPVLWLCPFTILKTAVTADNSLVNQINTYLPGEKGKEKWKKTKKNDRMKEWVFEGVKPHLGFHAIQLIFLSPPCCLSLSLKSSAETGARLNVCRVWRSTQPIWL